MVKAVDTVAGLPATVEITLPFSRITPAIAVKILAECLQLQSVLHRNGLRIAPCLPE